MSMLLNLGVLFVMIRVLSLLGYIWYGSVRRL